MMLLGNLLTLRIRTAFWETKSEELRYCIYCKALFASAIFSPFLILLLLSSCFLALSLYSAKLRRLKREQRVRKGLKMADANIYITGDSQRDAANALKRFLTGQFVKFFLLISPSNASKRL